jgi:threonine aldolase
MNKFNRRSFILNSGLIAGGISAGFRFPSKNQADKQLRTMQEHVQFTRDGMDMTPLEISLLLQEMAEKGKIQPDSYSRGGVVEKLEEKFASILGKERAVFMPTGTLANHIAIRKLAGNKRRVIVQADSHIYRDSGDCAQNLSDLNLLPLNKDKVGFSLDDVKETLETNRQNRVKTPVGAISIESPVRRHNNAMFDYEEIKKISSLAREKNIGIHLDGARLFNAVVHSGIEAQVFASLFDTVYISMYKDFNAPSGAILAGTKEFTKDLYHTRRMFGGGMPQVWPFAAVALKYADSFIPEYKKAQKNADAFFTLLTKDSAFDIEKIPNGTNVFILKVRNTDLQKFRSKLLEKNINLPAPIPDKNGFAMKVNVTLNRKSPEELSDTFKKSLVSLS